MKIKDITVGGVYWIDARFGYRNRFTVISTDFYAVNYRWSAARREAYTEVGEYKVPTHLALPVNGLPGKTRCVIAVDEMGTIVAVPPAKVRGPYEEIAAEVAAAKTAALAKQTADRAEERRVRTDLYDRFNAAFGHIPDTERPAALSTANIEGLLDGNRTLHPLQTIIEAALWGRGHA